MEVFELQRFELQKGKFESFLKFVGLSEFLVSRSYFLKTSDLSILFDIMKKKKLFMCHQISNLPLFSV